MPTVTLDDVKKHLNITRGADDAELLDFLAAATAAVEKLVGPLAARTVTEEIDEHGPRIVLSQTPVQSVESVLIEPWLGADPMDDTAAWRLNKTTGVLRRMVIGGSLPYYGRGSIFTVTYTVGRDTVPPDLYRAVLTQVGEMWRSQRGSMPMQPGSEAEPSYVGTVGFLAPSVMELLLPHLIPPGAA